MSVFFLVLKKSMKEKFLLNQEIVFLNHGSFGACPKDVFYTYQQWQRELETQPVEFLIRKSTNLLQNAREKLAEFLNASKNNIAFVQNTTIGVNAVVDSLNLTTGDEVLTTNLEYGACDRAWQFSANKFGYDYKKLEVNLPVLDKTEIVKLFEQGINKNTKVIFLSHITSSTALILPVQEICKLAKQKGIITVIDGAHAPGQLDLNLDQLGADIYIGNCHKWLLSPKSAAFIYCKPELQTLIKPSVVSWGNLWEYPNKNQFIADFEMQGTRDYSAFLSVPAAIDFWKQNVEHILFDFAKKQIKKNSVNLTKLLGTKPITNDLDMFRLMYAHPLPNGIDPIELKNKLYDKFKIEIPITRHKNLNLIRLSFQIYNSEQEYDFLLESLKNIL